MINVAKNKYKDIMSSVEINIGDICKMPYLDNSIDLTVCFRFLPWIVPFNVADNAMREMSRVTKKYGIFELCVGKHKTGDGKTLAQSTLWDRLNEEELNLWLRVHNFKTIKTIPIYDNIEHPGLTVFLCEKISN